jgi:hypothetical protein
MARSSVPWLFLCLSVGLAWRASAGAVSAVQPGSARDCNDIVFYPERWKESKTSTMLYPWPGQEVVFLTTRQDLDHEVMARLLTRLDDGWRLYAELTGRRPEPFKLFDGKPALLAIPNADLTCGFGCGYIGCTGIEFAGFYDEDHKLLREHPQAMPHYYFYEMGRNFYTFGERHSLFITGYAVFMRYVCMDVLKCDDPDIETRRGIEVAEELLSKSDMSFLQGFTTLAGLDEKAPRLKNKEGEWFFPSDQPVMYASVMLKLRREYGREKWLKRFFAQLATCPEIEPKDESAARRQSLSWLVAASCAAQKDLSPVFADRWRMPLSPQTRRTLSGTNWSDPNLAAGQVLKSLPEPQP